MSEQQSPVSVIDALKNALETAKASDGCAVDSWAAGQDENVRELLAKIQENRNLLSMAKVYKELDRSTLLPFGISTFRSHMAGACICQK